MKRDDQTFDDSSMEESNEGDWVECEDCEAEIARLREENERMEKAIKEVGGLLNISHLNMTCGPNSRERVTNAQVIELIETLQTALKSPEVNK